MIGRRGVFGSVAAAAAGAKMAVRGMAEQGKWLSQAINTAPDLRGPYPTAGQVEVAPVWQMLHNHPLAESFRKAERFRHGMQGLDGHSFQDLSVLAIKSYSPWYARKKMVSNAMEQKSWSQQLAEVVGLKFPARWSK